MRSPEPQPLFPAGAQCEFRYRPIKLCHPIAGFCYGIKGEWTDRDGRTGCMLLPDISCDYFLVSRLAARCTAGQLDPEQLLSLLGRLPF